MTTIQLPSYVVKIGWETALKGTVRCDVSTFNGLDVFSNAFTNFFTGTLDDVTADIYGDTATIARGRDDKLGSISAATFDFVLYHGADPTYYDPNSPSSPLHALNPGFVPMRPVVVQASIDGGTTYGRFYGFIRTASYDPVSRQCTVHAEDLFLWLSRSYPTVATLTNTTTQAAIGAILDACGWNDPAMRNLSSFGDAIPSYTNGNAGTTSALQLTDDLVTAERGLYYIDSSGRFVYEDRNARSRRTSPKAVFTDMQLALDSGTGTSGISVDEIENQLTVTDASGIPTTGQNLASQQMYGAGADTPISSALIPSGTGAAIAAWEIAQYGTLRSPMTAMVDNEALPVLFTCDLQDRFRIANTLSGSSDDYHLERIEETFGPGSLYATATLTLSRRSVSGFVFDYSTCDGADLFVS